MPGTSRGRLSFNDRKEAVMAEFDVLIRNGTIVDGTRVPAHRGDIGVCAGRVVAMGRIKVAPNA